MVFTRRRLAGKRDAALTADILINVVHFLPVESILLGVLPVCKRWWSISKSPSAWSYLYLGDASTRWRADDVHALVSRAGNHLVEFTVWDCFSWIFNAVLAQGCQPRLRKITLLGRRRIHRTIVEDLKPLMTLQHGGFREIYGPCSSCWSLTRFRPTLTVREEDATIRTVSSSLHCVTCDYGWCFICSSKCARPICACLCKENDPVPCPIMSCGCQVTDDDVRVSIPLLE